MTSKNRTQYNSFGASSVAASDAATKNEVEKWKLMNKMSHLDTQEKYYKHERSKDIHRLKDELLKMVATGHVFKTHKFAKYDPFCKMEKIEEEMEEDNENGFIHNNLSVKQIPKLAHSVSTLDMFSTSSSSIKISNKQRPKSQSLPNIHQLMYAELDDNSKLISGNTEETENLPIILPFRCLANMSIWNQKDESVSVDTKPKKRYRKKKVFPKMREEFRQMFPGNCKTSYSMRRFVDKEADIMINQNDSPLYSQKNTKLQRLIEQAKLPELVQRRKTTSAIFRDFKSYKLQDNPYAASSEN